MSSLRTDLVQKLDHPFNYLTIGMTAHRHNHYWEEGRGMALILPDAMIARDVSHYEDSVKTYYDAVDRGDLETVFALFSDDIIYRRCDSTFTGRKEFERFYTEGRGISVRHHIDMVIATPGIVAVEGRYTGENDQQDTIEGSFADFFLFNPSGNIEERNTYLAEDDVDLASLADCHNLLAEQRLISTPRGIAAETFLYREDSIAPFMAQFIPLDENQHPTGEKHVYLGAGAERIE